jgi:hypothetical protein
VLVELRLVESTLDAVNSATETERRFGASARVVRPVVTSCASEPRPVSLAFYTEEEPAWPILIAEARCWSLTRTLQ